MNILRRLPLSRLLLLIALVIAIGVSAASLASALGSSPVPPSRPLADAIHDAMTGPTVEGVSANVTLTDHMLEGANLASGDPSGGEGLGGLASSPLVTGASGRLWIAKNGDVRLELQAEKGDTQIVWDGHTLSLYDASANTEYRYTPSAQERGEATQKDQSPDDQKSGSHEAPSVAKIEEAIAHLSKHANVSGATPTDVAGQPAYTVRVSPKEGGSLIAGIEYSFDATHGTPLRTAIYSTTSSTPVIELAATEISYGPVESSVFNITPPANAKVEEVKPPVSSEGKDPESSAGTKPNITQHGKGLSTIFEVEDKTKSSSSSSGPLPEGLPKVDIKGASATELKTELGTILSFERSGVRYFVAGAVTSEAIEAFARGL